MCITETFKRKRFIIIYITGTDGADWGRAPRQSGGERGRKGELMNEGGWVSLLFHCKGREKSNLYNCTTHMMIKRT